MDMMSNIPMIDCFFREKNTLCGYAYHHPDFENKAKVRSNYFDRIETWIDGDGQSYRVAICAGNEKWKLGKPASESEIRDFIEGRDELSLIDRERQRDQVSDLKRGFIG